MNPNDARTYAQWYRHVGASAMVLLKSMSMDEAPSWLLDEARAIANRAEWLASQLETYARRIEVPQ